MAMNYETWLAAKGINPADLTAETRVALLKMWEADSRIPTAQALSDPEAARMEQERIRHITRLCDIGVPDQRARIEELRSQAVAGSLAVEDLQRELLGILRDSRPKAGSSVHPGDRGGPGQADVITTSLLLACGYQP